LGRGLEALLSRIPAQGEPAQKAPPTVPFPVQDAPAAGASDAGAGRSDAAAGRDVPSGPTPAEPVQAAHPPRVETRLIDSNPYQPRADFDETEIQSLAESLQTHGLLQPVVVRRHGDRYQLIAGERRLRAAVKAGWSDVPVQVVEADDRQMAELAIVENLQRKDLSPLEKASAFHRYLEEYQATQEDLASRLKLDRSTIANLIRLLELPAAVQEALRQMKITQGHARALLSLGDEGEQVAFCTRIQQEGLSVRQTESLVQDAIAQADAEPLAVAGKTTRSRRSSQHLAELEQEFRAALGLKVKLTESGRGKGKLVIPFSTHEEFERIRDVICGEEDPAVRAHAG
jgi:ParB family chromosome partitioning protein